MEANLSASNLPGAAYLAREYSRKYDIPRSALLSGRLVHIIRFPICLVLLVYPFVN